MNIVKKKLADLKPPERNIRLHTDKQIEEFRRSVKKFGQIRPIVIDEDNVIWCGNGLYETLCSMGYEEADCYVKTGLSEADKKKLMMADNKIFDLGVDDLSVFDAFVIELQDDLDIPGYDEDILQALVMDAGDVSEMLSSYGIVDEERTEAIRSTKERYEERDAKMAETAIEHAPSVPEAVREAAGYAAPFKADEVEKRFIVCPKCGERIWL